MAKVLLAWELGGGLGHLMNLRPLAQELSIRGHRVIVASRDLSSIVEMFGGAKVEYVQAPFKHEKIQIIEPTCTIAQILHNVGFGNFQELEALTGAWRTLYTAIRPDVLICDHSPTALLASRGLSMRRAVLGNGFTIPHDASPLPNLRTFITPDLDVLNKHESCVLQNINRVLGSWAEQPLERVTQFYADVDETFLLTFRELDFYASRDRATYWGKWSVESGQAPAWPAGNEPKILGYLKPFQALPNLLTMLQQMGNPAFIYLSDVNPSAIERYRRSHLQFADGPINLVRAASECDIAILNGTHSSAATMLLAGKPTLHIPIFLEHGVNSDAVARLGAGIKALPNNPAQISGGLKSLLQLDQFGNAARTFADKYRGFDPAMQLANLIDRAERLATG